MLKCLELDFNEPYIEIVLISKIQHLLQKKQKLLKKKKKLQNKAPIDGIKISSLNNLSEIKIKNYLNDKFSYSLKIADFYYKKTAQLMIDRIKSEIFIK